MSEQQFPIFYNEMLTIETAVSSANCARTMFLLKFCWDNEGKTRTAASLQTNGTRQVLCNLLGQRSHMLMSEQPLSRVLISEQQFLIFYNEMLTIETAVSKC